MNGDTRDNDPKHEVHELNGDAPAESDSDALLAMLSEDPKDEETTVMPAPVEPDVAAPLRAEQTRVALVDDGGLPRSALPPPKPSVNDGGLPRSALPPRQTPGDAGPSAHASASVDVDEVLLTDDAQTVAVPAVEEAGEAAAPRRPPPPRASGPRAPAPTFEREEDASALLLRQQQRDAWVGRAEWLRAEAARQPEAQRGRTLLVVSELLAMAGEEAEARAVASEALTLTPQAPLAHRQVRAIASRDAGWASVLDALDLETRSAVTAEAKCHGALLGAEIARLVLQDDEGAKRRVEQAHRAFPGDPRPHVLRFGEALAAAPTAEDGTKTLMKARIGGLPELGPLAAASQQVIAHRVVSMGDPQTPPGSTGNLPAGTPYETLLRARRSAEASDLGAVIAGLEALAASPSLALGALWLAGTLAAVTKATRARAVPALGAVLGGSHGTLASRALAARAIELGDGAAARAAIESAAPGAFTAADRVVLASLTRSDADVSDLLDELEADPELAPLAAAASASRPRVKDAVLKGVGAQKARASAALGRALATDHAESFAGAVTSFMEAVPEASLAKALILELLVQDKDAANVGRALHEWRDDAELELERGLAGALLAEAAGDLDRAREELQRLRVLDPTNEAIARAALSHAEPDATATILAEHAQALPKGPRAATLLIEAATRLATAGHDPESDALLRQALETDPNLPLAHHLGERAARVRGDREALLEWVRARRDATAEPLEQANDLVREALLVSEENPGSAASLLETALRARPADVALREVYERISPEVPADRASFRMDRAREATGVEAARLWLEAAFELERGGDLAGAAKAAKSAVEAGEQGLAPIAAYRAAIAGHGTSEVIDELLPRARETTDPVERLEIYERLAELDERGRGDAASALLWRRSILEETGGHLPTLRRVASTLVSANRDAELEPVALDIARALEGPEAVAHAMLAARLRQMSGAWDDTREAVEIAYKQKPPSTWALRQSGAHGRARGDVALVLETDRALAERTTRPSEIATLSLRAAESARKVNLVDDALAFLSHAKELVPGHFVVALELADLLAKSGNASGAAAALDEAAEASVTSAERARILYRAAQIWHDEVGARDKARADLEAVAAIDPSYADVFDRLQAIYVAEGARAELASLLERRLEAVTDPGERVEMEVLRGRALADVGDAAAARRALAAALEANPDHVEALSAFAEVSALEQDFSAAEQAWIRLARLVPEPERQAAIYYRLGEVYDEHLPNPERAELAYQEILKHAPGDVKARERLVALYLKTNDAPRAIEQQTLLVNGAEAPEEKCARTTRLAEIYEQVGDVKKAEATLLQARKTWPKDEVALGALARFYQRTNQAQAAAVLLDRAVADARRALGTGRFEPYLFSTIATVAELKNRPDAASVAKAAVAALDGGRAALEGAGAAAGEAALDDLLAPEVLSPAFRDLLRRTGTLLDTAFPFDLGSVRAAPLPPQLADLGELIRDTAAGYSLPAVEVYVSNVLGPTCVPVSAHPPVLVLGQPLVTATRDDVRLFLVHRALKVIQVNGAPLARTAPIDLWPLVAAYLRAFSPTWTPQGVDQAKLTDFYGRITRALGKNTDPQAALLAADVIGNIGNRASTLNTVINGWGNRAGLLAVGDLNVAITGIAWAGGHTNAPPASGKDRTTWIGRNAEARELVVFSVSDAYADARSQLDLASAGTELVDLIEVAE